MSFRPYGLSPAQTIAVSLAVGVTQVGFTPTREECVSVTAKKKDGWGAETSLVSY